MIISSIAGMWPGGSLRIMLNQWIGAVLIYVVIVTIPISFRDHWSVMGSMAWATAAILLMVHFRGAEVGSRLGIRDSSLENPNDLALYLVVGLPFSAAYALDKNRRAALRVIMVLVFAYGLLTVLRTGSRMGLIALAAQVLALFLAERWKIRLWLLVTIAGTALATMIFVPGSVRARYRTWFEPAELVGEDAGALHKAAGSTQSRWELLKLSVRVTGQHPFLGVGPGEFGDVAREMTGAPGVKGTSQQTHNTYTQVSSECGIIPGVLYIGIVVFAVNAARRIRKTTDGLPGLWCFRQQALCLYASTVGYAACAFFGSLAYSMHLLLLCALIVSLDLILAATITSLRTPDPFASPALFPVMAGRSGGPR
jgi:energy-coupling factor transporter transmembrane protein EcfT